MANLKLNCWSCTNQWEVPSPVGRSESCMRCGWDARVCLNCKFYEKSAYRECREERAELVKDKDKRNFCDWFEPSQNKTLSSKVESSNPLDQLFGGSNSEKKPSKLELEWNDFFNKSKS